MALGLKKKIFIIEMISNLINLSNLNLNLNFNLIIDNNLTDYGFSITWSLILGWSIFFFSTRNTITDNEFIAGNNVQTIINNEVIAGNNVQTTIDNENLAGDNVPTIIDNENIASDSVPTIINNENIASGSVPTIINNDPETNVMDDLFNKTKDVDPFIMPDVDLNVCSIQELKHYEISSIFQKELAEKCINDQQLTEIISNFTQEQLLTNAVNDAILVLITSYIN